MLYVGIAIWNEYSFKGALTNTQHFGGAHMRVLKYILQYLHVFILLFSDVDIILGASVDY
jgi:hypothetical protein